MDYGRSNIRARLARRNENSTPADDKRDISKSATSLVPAPAKRPQIELRRRKSAAELNENVAVAEEEAPVLRRRRFTKKQRKSFIIEAEAGLLLAAGRADSTSTDDDDDDDEKPTASSSASSKRTPEAHEKGPAARRANRLLLRRHHKSTGRLEMLNESSGLRGQSRSLSVRDLNADDIDFTNRESVSRWTSQILAELDSLPSSCVDLSTTPSRMTSSMFAGSHFDDGSLNKSTSSLPTWRREREASIGASTIVAESDDSEATTTTPPPPSTNKDDQKKLLEKLFDLSSQPRDFTRSIEPIPPPPRQKAPPVPAKRTRFLSRHHHTLDDVEKKLHTSIAQMSMSMYGRVPMDHENARVSMMIDTEANGSNEANQCGDEILERWRRMSECRMRGEESTRTLPSDRKPSVNRVISKLLRTIEDSRYSAPDRPTDIDVVSVVAQDIGTQTTAFGAASRSSSFDWINEPTEGVLRDIRTPISATPHQQQLVVSRHTPASSSSDEADREVALIAMSTEEKCKNERMLEEIDEGLSLLLEYGEPSAVQLHKEMQEQKLLKRSPLPPRINAKTYDSLPNKFRRSGEISSVYDNMPWDRKRHVTSTGQFSPLVLPRNPTHSHAGPATTTTTTNADEKPKPINHNAPRSSFALQLAERDAEEACEWLKQAGFPQYVKQFEDGKFPIETSSVERDHGFLGTDSLHALFRRIDTLNRCAIMKVDNVVMRRRLNNDYLYAGYDEDDNVALAGNWQYQRHSQTWSRVPPNEPIYAGGAHSRLVSTKPNWQPYMEKQTDRQVSRTDWYEAPSRAPITNGHTTLDAPPSSAVANANANKLQRSQSERIRERARAIMKKMDLRSTSRRRKESRQRAEPNPNIHNMIISDPVLVSYETGSADSMRMMSTARPNHLPDRGRALYSDRHGAAAAFGGSVAPRSKSARRQGIVLSTPSSPDSSDDSFGTTASSGLTSSSLIGATPRRRDFSMPPPRRTNYDYAPPMVPPRRERTPFDAYLYPTSNTSSLNRSIQRNNGLARYDGPPVPERDYRGLLQRTDRAHNLVIQPDGYYMHDMSPEVVHRRIEDSPSTSHSSHLKVDTQKSESSVEHTDEENPLHRRRDSGVGSSLSRSPSGPSNQRIAHSILPNASTLISSSMISTNTTSLSSSGSWKIFKKRGGVALMDHSLTSSTCTDETCFDDIELQRSMDSLNIIEMARIRKLAYLRITACLEKSMGTPMSKMCIGGIEMDETAAAAKPNNWSVQKLIRKMKISDVKLAKDGEETGVFGVGLDVIYKRSGFCLPRPILEILRFLRQMAPDTLGIFRKNGVKSRIAELRAIADRETSPSGDVFVGANSLESGQVHDAADLLKQYLRELPEPLMTVRMSEVFANIFTYVPEVERLTAVKFALLLLPDENREALQTLMMFLKDVARKSQVNNMTAQNLAVCFTPSLFQLSASRLDKISSGSRRHKTIGAAGMPTEKEMKETRACQNCLTMLIEYAKTVFMVPDCVDERPEFEDDIPPLKDLGLKGPRSFLVDRVMDMIKDHSDRWKSWNPEGTFCGIEISSKKANDSHPLKTFRVWSDVEAPPKVVMSRIMKERHVWDASIINWRHVERVNPADTDIHQYVINETIGHPTKDCHLVRFHSSGLAEIRGACAIAERSVQCGEPQMLGGIPATVFDQRFLIEPRSGGQSRVTYIARVDLKGRTYQWYNKIYGTIMCRQVIRLRDTFQSEYSNGPETKI
ncbi:unnamed protein product [Caenorhabditis bovis]|uniref:Uncharacterized protein n=1 Tax=Caenorhabditis bovis TaxID=2654633 RepID=A0A8S1EUF3_9PELO|nr:unnamed protein product [Caenorhabditis bovis]